MLSKTQSVHQVYVNVHLAAAIFNRNSPDLCNKKENCVFSKMPDACKIVPIQAVHSVSCCHSRRDFTNSPSFLEGENYHF